MREWFRKKKSELHPTTNLDSDYHVDYDRMEELTNKYNKWKKELDHYNDHIMPTNITNSQWTYKTYPSNITISDRITPNTTIEVDGTLEVKGRDVLKELDELREILLLLKRDVKLEEKYPELKQAYDDYMELYRGLLIAEKFYETGNNDET
jgi:hypothetical protein